MTLSERLKQLRTKLQMTQDEFAAAYDLPIGTIKNWEQNRRKRPSQAVLLVVKMIEKDPEGMMEIAQKTTTVD